MRARAWWGMAVAVAMVPAAGLAVPRRLTTAVATGDQRSAQQPAQRPAVGTQIEVLVIDAGPGPGGIDPGLARLSQLRRAPFNMFATMRLLSRSTLALGSAPARAELPDGSATVSLVSREGGRYTFQVALSQGSRGGNMTFVASAGEPVFTVRSNRPDRAMILGFIVH